MGVALSKIWGWWRYSVREGSYPESSSSSSSFLSCYELEEFNREATETYQSSSSTSTNYDVFLSFCGKDTRASFTSHLYHELDRAGIQTFMDEEELKKGEEIAPNLLKAIAESRISIPIFSTNYASSKWCLNELVKMMESRDTNGQIVLPIFFNVDPRHVRKQIEDFGKLFHQLAEKFDKGTVERWKKALREAGGLKGWDLKNPDNRNESKLIQIVVKNVSCELEGTSFHVPENLVGIDSCVKELLNLLNLESKDVKIVGLWGMGGIGKTTAAEAVFNQIRRSFEDSIFLEDIREASKQPKGLVRLQKQLLSALLKRKIQSISNVNEGKSFIKKFIHAKKVLIILDDVDNIEQLEALAGKPNWFGPGSRIIITSRDEHVLNIHKVHGIYEVKELDFDQSLHLFSMHTFGKDQPPHDFLTLAEDVVLIAGGLPLALKVLGSFLSDKISAAVWRSTLDRLKKILHKDVQEKLKISYDGLDDLDKEIFLDIACFFIGTDREYVIYIGEGCGFSAELGIENLIQRSLVKINDRNELRMHDQLRDMGRHIVRQESADEPGKRSRLWFQAEVLNVLKGQEGTRNVKGLSLKFEEKGTSLKEVCLRTKAFTAMSKLRLLQIDNAHLVGGFNRFPSDLRWLSWKGCSLESIPTNFRIGKLIVLDLSYSMIKQVWNDLDQDKGFPELKVLSLSECEDLTETPDFSRLPNIEKLNLEGCIKLEELHSSICKLKSLKDLNLSGCSNLNKVSELLGSLKEVEVIKLDDCKLLCRSPDSISNMRNLKTLSLDGTSITELPNAVGLLEKIERISVKRCSDLIKLPDSMGKMGLLREFFIDETGIFKLPEDVGMLSSLTELSMINCREFRGFPESFGSLVNLQSLHVEGNSKLVMLPNSFSGLCSLQTLVASRCNFSEGGIPSDFGKLSSLLYLDLSYNNFCSLPASISGLSHLCDLFLKNCQNLQYLPEMPLSLERLEAQNCVSVERLSDLSDLKQVWILNLSNCKKLVKIHGIEKMESLEDLCTNGCSRAILNSVSKGLSQGLPRRLSLWTFPGSEIPDWFTPMKLSYCPSLIGSRRYEIRLDCEEVPTRLGNPEQHQIIGLVLCFVFTSQPEISFFDITVIINRKLASGFRIIHSHGHQDQICLFHLRPSHYIHPNELEGRDGILFMIKPEREEVEKGGMHVVYKETKQSTSWREVEIKKAAMHVVYEETVQSTFNRIGDFISHSSHDDDVGGEPSSGKNTRFQLLDHDDDDDDDDDVDGDKPSSRKGTKFKLLNHDDVNGGGISRDRNRSQLLDHDDDDDDDDVDDEEDSFFPFLGSQLNPDPSLPHPMNQ